MLYKPRQPSLFPHEIPQRDDSEATSSPRATSPIESPGDRPPSPPARPRRVSFAPDLERQSRHTLKTSLPPPTYDDKPFTVDELFEQYQSLEAKRQKYAKEEQEKRKVTKLRDRQKDILNQQEQLLEGKPAAWLIERTRELNERDENDWSM